MKERRSVITFPHVGDADVAAHREEHRPKSAIVFLHGLGDKPESWQESIEWLGGKIGNTKAVCLAAPLQPITKNNGELLTAWCDALGQWPLTPESPSDIKGLLRSVQTVHEEVRKLIAEGIPSERIIIGGFSQGAATATLATLLFDQKLGGGLNLSGWLATCSNVQVHPANQSTPLFWAHGATDEVIAPECQAAGVAALKAAGVSVIAKEYAFGHDSNEAEFDDILAFLKERLQ